MDTGTTYVFDDTNIVNAINNLNNTVTNFQSYVASHTVNIEHGIKFLMYIAVAFFVWKVIRIFYNLFGGIFFGGI